MIDFSLTLPRFHDAGERQPYRRTFEFCRTVDELGYAGGFIGRHPFSPEVKDEAAPFVFLSAIAAHTERMRLREAWVGEDDAEVEREWYPRALSFHRYYWDAGTRGDEHDPVLPRVAARGDPPLSGVRPRPRLRRDTGPRRR